MTSATLHTLRRTSPKGGDFIGTCILCGTPGLTLADMHRPCPNQRALSQGAALLEVIDPSVEELRDPVRGEAVMVTLRNGKRIYGRWAGRPEGVPEDPARCIHQVFPPRGIHYQCLRKRGHGPDGLYCKQHAAMLPTPDKDSDNGR